MRENAAAAPQERQSSPWQRRLVGVRKCKMCRPNATCAAVASKMQRLTPKRGEREHG